MLERPATDRFATINALRGIAAICVLLYHAGPSSPIPMPGGYLAVDLFFALSGFVIAHSYSRRLDSGLSFDAFMRLRVARLWPMLVLGALLGIVIHGGHAGMVLLVPNPGSPTSLFPTNPPYWSLLLEMIAYAAFAALWTYRSRALLIMIVGSSAAYLTVAALGDVRIDNFGAAWQTLGAGLARLGFAFGTGIAIWHIRRDALHCRTVTGKGWLLPLAFVVCAVFTPTTNLGGLAVILLAVPVMVWLATIWEIGDTPLAGALGDLSYPLYCIHAPLVAAMEHTGVAPALPFALPLVALALDRFCDAPARRRLKQLLMRKYVRPAALATDAA